MWRAGLRRWYSKSPGLLWGLLPLMWLYRGAAAWHRRRGIARRLTMATANLPPVWVVGNLTVGGVGKTPVVIALAHYLKTLGRKPGIISRGYGGRLNKTPTWVRPGVSAADVGDEPLLIVERTGCPLVIGRDRVAALTLVSQAAVDVVISDDGLQHAPLPRQIEWVVMDGERGLGNGQCLPVGPLREPASRLASVDAVLCIGPPNTAFSLPVPHFICELTHAPLYRLLAPDEQLPLSAWAGQPVQVVAGIGDPERLFRQCSHYGWQVQPRAYPDHHRFSPADLRAAAGVPVVITEKDAVKCRRFAHDQVWVLPLQLPLPNSLQSWIERRLA